MTVILLFISCILSLGCAYWNYTLAKQYKKRMHKALKKCRQLEFNKNVNKMAIMSPRFESPFSEARQN